MNVINRPELKAILSEIKRQNTFFTVEFTKADGSPRRMQAQFRHLDNQRTVGGKWANGNAGKPSDHGLIVVTDLAAQKAGKNAYRSIKLDRINSLTHGKKYMVVN